MAIFRADYEEVLKTVEAWPPDQRLTLVQDILKTLATPPQGSHPRRRTLKHALGLLETGVAPSDEQVQQWLDEQRLEKYT